jgi:hypothetical protein
MAILPLFARIQKLLCFSPSLNLAILFPTRPNWFYSSPSNFEYDDLNRVTMFEDGNYGGMYARSHYQYDTVGREAAVWRDEDGSKGDRFHYGTDNQLTGAHYKGDWAWAGDPNNPERTVDYAYRPDMLNRQSVTDNGAVTNYASPSGMRSSRSEGEKGSVCESRQYGLGGLASLVS